MKWSFFQDVVRYAARGANGMGLWRSKLEEFGVEEASDLLAEMKMEVTSLSWAGGFTGCSGMGHHQAIDDCISALEMAAVVRAPTLIVYPGQRNGHTERHSRRLFHDAVAELVPVARELNVSLAVEPMSGCESPRWSMFAGFQETMREIENYAPNELGIVLDLYHLGLDRDVARAIPGVINRVRLVQIADRAAHGEALRLIPGAGDVSLQPWTRLLAYAGYDGPYEFEIFGNGVAHLGYETVIHAGVECLREHAALHQTIRHQAALDRTRIR
jgi:sugar phosphate isomerase/epimerase